MLLSAAFLAGLAFFRTTIMTKGCAYLWGRGGAVYVVGELWRASLSLSGRISMSMQQEDNQAERVPDYWCFSSDFDQKNVAPTPTLGIVFPPVKKKTQQHKWFRNVDWVALRNRRVYPPWVPPSMKPGCTQCFLDWKAEPPAGAGAAGACGGENAHTPSDQVQEYSRIKVPPGCALRPPPPPQQPAPGELT